MRTGGCPALPAESKERSCPRPVDPTNSLVQREFHLEHPVVERVLIFQRGYGKEDHGLANGWQATLAIRGLRERHRDQYLPKPSIAAASEGTPTAFADDGR